MVALLTVFLTLQVGAAFVAPLTKARPRSVSRFPTTTTTKSHHLLKRWSQPSDDVTTAMETVVLEEEPVLTEEEKKQREIARLKAAEKFIEEETGKFVCKVCGYKYDPAVGAYNVVEGTAFADLPASWRCPTCRAQKDAFEPETLTIAGFADNRSFGLGGNTMTEGDKSALIYGGLAFFFLLFMSGYLLN